MSQTDIVIIGAGLTGLTLNYLLKDSGLAVAILEARGRAGGRIHTVAADGSAPVEMGATWLGPDDTQLMSLIDDLDVGLFPQVLGNSAIYEPNSMSPHQLVQLPDEQQPSYRIEGGTVTLIDRLASYVNPKNLHTRHRVTSINQQNETLLVSCQDAEFEASTVVSTLPPKLFWDSLDIKPGLPSELKDVMSETQTWMGESIKFGLSFETPFWRGKNSSGTLFSNAGPVTEMYDHSDVSDQFFALKGFVNPGYASLSKKDRLDMILKQLRNYYGGQIDEYTAYYETVWSDEEFTYTPYETPLQPHQNNGHILYQKPWLDGTLWFAGAETSDVSPGYMNGAVNSAYAVFDKLTTALDISQVKS